MKKRIFYGVICICFIIGLMYLALSDMIARHGTAYVKYEIVYPDSTIQYTDTVNFIYCGSDIARFERHNLEPIRVTSYKGSNYIEVYYYEIVQNTCPIRLKTAKIISK